MNQEEEQEQSPRAEEQGSAADAGKAKPAEPSRWQRARGAASNIAGMASGKVAENSALGKAGKAAEEKFAGSKAGQVAGNIAGMARGKIAEDSALGKARGKLEERFADSKAGKAVQAGADRLNQAKQLRDQVKKRATDAAIGAVGAATGGTAAVAAKALQTAKRAHDKLKKYGINLTFGLDKYWGRHKWKIIIGSCLIGLAIVGMVVILPIFIISQLFILDRGHPPDVVLEDNFRRLLSENRVVFHEESNLAAVLEALEEKEIAKPVMEMINFLGTRHQLVVLGTANLAGGAAFAGDFDSLQITAADFIKCTENTPEGPREAGRWPVQLSSSFNWQETWSSWQARKRSESGGIAEGEVMEIISPVCAIDYYPTLETAPAGAFSFLGPGEFPLSEIANAGPLAAREKIAELTSEIISGAIRDSGDNPDQIIWPPEEIAIDSAHFPAINAALSTIMEIAGNSAPAIQAFENPPVGIRVSFW